MVFSYQEFLQYLGLYFWPFVRLGAAMVMIPVFAMPAVPVRTRLLLALFITLAVAPQLDLPPPIDPFTAAGVLTLMQQVVIGLAMGLVFLIIFQAFVVGGHFVSMGMGLAFASMADPTSGLNSPVVSQFFTIIATLLFLALNGHLLVIQIVVDSFRLMPPGTHMLSHDSLWQLVKFGAWMFSAGVLMALPVVTTLLLVNFAFGIMSRAAPAMNIFAVGFPITLLTGLVLLSFMSPFLLEHLRTLIEQGVELIRTFHLEAA
ncbi:flagellar biosynthetic protein FliR [Sulfurivirga sp.]|uniref:flagellar biosynthetic protein FliR n=1 Tax=Sulfurivirga sp. TaxID=2614236 RepID=UPI0025E268CA|nr:flagellar biosynthetic protein FliR [Sulfurivirga sp.]